jgi:hypothetical protein
MSRAIGRARGGFSIADVVVGFGLVVLVVGVLMAALGLSQRGEKSVARERCVLAMIVAQQRIEADLRQIVQQPHFEATNLRPGQRSDAIGFWACAQPVDGPEVVTVQSIVYRSGPRGLVRVAGGREERIADRILRDAEFIRLSSLVGPVVRVVLTASAGAGGPRLRHAFQVRLRVRPDSGLQLALPPAGFPDDELAPPSQVQAAES